MRISTLLKGEFTSIFYLKIDDELIIDELENRELIKFATVQGNQC